MLHLADDISHNGSFPDISNMIFFQSTEFSSLKNEDLYYLIIFSYNGVL